MKKLHWGSGLVGVSVLHYLGGFKLFSSIVLFQLVDNFLFMKIGEVQGITWASLLFLVGSSLILFHVVGGRGK